MRSLSSDTVFYGGTEIPEGGATDGTDKIADLFEERLSRLKSQHHAACLFNNAPACFPEMTVSFDDAGMLHGMFVPRKNHQGYNGIAHGGILSGVIDASMAQCLMGHGIAAYTTDLTVKFRNPVLIDISTSVKTWIVCNNIEILYSMKCEIRQEGRLVVQASGRFYRFEQVLRNERAAN